MNTKEKNFISAVIYLHDDLLPEPLRALVPAGAL